MLISIHIPKTAGTTLGYMLDYGSERRIMFVYDKSYQNVSNADEDMWLRHKDFIVDRFDVIHGHFYYSKFSNVFDDAKYITCLRHPIDRLVSQWNHELNETGRKMSEKAKKGMTIVDWVKEEGENLSSVYKKHLDGRRLSDYYYIFIQEFMEPCWSLFVQKTGFVRNDQYINNTGLPRLNDGLNRAPPVSIPEAQLQELFKLLQPDVEVYVKAKELVLARIRNASANI